MDDQRDPDDDAPTQWFPPVPPPVAGWQPEPADETVLIPRVEDPPEPPAGAWPSWQGAAAYGTQGSGAEPSGTAAYGTEAYGAAVYGAESGASGPVPGMAEIGPADDAEPAAPGVHRQGGGGPARPWALLGGILVAALLAVGGLVWMIGASIGHDRPAPAAAPPATRSATPSPTPSPTEAEVTAPYTPPPTSAVPTVTLPPPPTATRVVPTPRRTTPKPTDSTLVEVPDVVGMRVSTARRTLERAGLNANVLFGDGGGNNRQVIAQQPSGGRVPRGTTILLLAGRTR